MTSPEKFSASLLEKMHTAVESSMDGIALLNAGGVYYYLNEVHLRMFGYEKEEELLGKSWQHIYGEEEIDRINKNIFPQLMKDKMWKGETTGKSREGNPVHQEITLTIMEDGGIVCICRDIEQRIRNQQQIRIHSQILETSNSMLMTTDPDRNIIWANPSFCRITGYSMEEILGKNPGALLQGEKSDKETIQRFKEAIRNNESFNCELLNYKKDGTTYWAEIKCQPLLNEKGELEGFFAIEEDITERKETEALLAENKLRLELAIDGTGAGLWDWNIRDNTVYYSSSWKQNLGYEDTEIAQNFNEWQSRVHPDDLEMVTALLQQHMEGKTAVYESEIRLRHKQGHYISFIDRGKITHRDKNGTPLRMTGIVFNISELKEAQQKLAESESRWNAALEGSEFGVWEWDLEHNSIYFSPKLKELYGYKDDELHPTPEFWISTCHPDDFEISRSALQEHLDNKTPNFISDRRVLHRDGHYRWFQSRGQVIRRDTNGKPLRVIGSVIDITERKKLEEELIKAKNAAEANVKTKRRFLANISHEIRTPMHAIMGIAEQLKQTPLNEKQDYYLAVINESSRALLDLINDVLDISKIEEGKIKIDQVPFNLREIVQHVHQLFLESTDRKGLNYTLEFDERLNHYFSGDPSRIRQVLMNILSNAVKFTESGSVSLCCRLLSRTGNLHIMSFECTDTGIGMNEDMKKRLFQDFSQEDDSFERKYGGSGLGLAITHELVQLMGGTIRILSEKNKGTTVNIVLSLPVSADQTVPVNEPMPANDAEPLSHLRVLVAEDNSFNRLLIQIMLTNNDIQFDMADNGLQAVEMASRGNYDLILMDIQMPEMNGVDATKRIRQFRGPDTPIIAITANAVLEELDSYMKEGLTDYLTKPFDEKRLIQKIREHLPAATTK